MRALVTGASGFLGRAVVQELLRRGHTVRAMIRPAADLGSLPRSASLEIFQGDLRTHPSLREALTGVDTVFHLAAVVAGSYDAQFAGTVVGTERLLAALATSETRRLILASTLSVYDWSAARYDLTEETPIVARLYERDDYAVTKVWQERLVRRAAASSGWSLTVLRPGYIWGPGKEWVAGAGIRIGRWLIVNGPLRWLPLTHVDNCAHCFVSVAEHPAAEGQTFNVVDQDHVRAWRFAGDYLRYSGQEGCRIPVPDSFCLATAWTAFLASRVLLGPRRKLPGLLIPLRYQARFKSLRFPCDKLRRLVGWVPPLPYVECLHRVFNHRSMAQASGGVLTPVRTNG